MENIIEIKNLKKKYDDKFELGEIDITIPKGVIVGLIGENGAGKTTLIKLMLNIIKSDNGEIKIFGKDNKRKEKEIKEDIGVVLDNMFFPELLNAKDINNSMKDIYKNWNSKLYFSYLKEFDLPDNKSLKSMSKGMRKKLEIATALAHKPKLLILDEPTSGLDPIMQNVFYDLLKEEKKKGTTIFYSTHILSEVSKICDRVGIIKDGKLIKIENMEEVSKKNLTFVTVTSEQVKDIEKDLKQNVVSKNEKTIKFANSIPHDELIKKLSKYKIDRILIEEATLEDVFMHYYQ